MHSLTCLDSAFTVFSSSVLEQPNKVYIGGLPENTRQEDLQNCFGKLGKIVNIELKYVASLRFAVATCHSRYLRVGYGFVVSCLS